MAVKLSPDTEHRIERLLASTDFDSADDLLSAALQPFEIEGFWERVEQENAEADEDVEAGRHRPVTDTFISELRAIVTRSNH